MSEFTLPSELLNGAEVTLDAYIEVQNLAQPHDVERAGDHDAIEEVMPSIHHFSEKAKCARILFANIENPTWETIVWGHSFGCRDGQVDFEAIQYVVDNYDMNELIA